MSKNRVLHGSTKKQMHTQCQERVNCLKIEKRENWVNYLTEQCKNTSSQQYNNKKLKKIKKKIKKVIPGEEIQTDVLQSIAKPLSPCSLKKTKDEISKQNIRQRVRIIQNLEYVFFKILTLVPTDFL